LHVGLCEEQLSIRVDSRIELLTVEDINFDRWKADIQIPLIYIRKVIDYTIDAAFVVSEELFEKYRDREPDVQFDISSLMTPDSGDTVLPIKDRIEASLLESGREAQDGVELDLLSPNVRVMVSGVWVECTKLTVSLTAGQRVYLKYLTPDEYSQIRNHARDTTIPLHVAVSGTFPILDDTFAEMPDGEIPVFSGIHIRAVEWIDTGSGTKQGLAL
jgi:hypothetical protein